MNRRSATQRLAQAVSGAGDDVHPPSLLYLAVWYSVMFLLAALFIFPFLWMVTTSVKTVTETNAWPPVWLPPQPQWSNYVQAIFGSVPFPRYFVNTLVIAVTVIIGDIVSCSMVAYGFARIRFPGRDLLFGLMMSTMMIPFIVRLVPLFVIFRKLGWINTFLPLTVPAFFGTPFFIFLVRQFFLTIPEELTDAAKIDGCSHLGLWWRILLPLCAPVLAVVAIFAFQNVWNDFLAPLIFLTSESKKTVLLGLYQLVITPYEKPWNLAMAATVVIISPLVLVFFFMQRYMVEGITVTGLKG